VVSDTNLIDNDGEIYDDMQNIEIKPSDVFIHIWTWKKTIQNVGKIKEAIVGKTFPDGARTTLDL
jgi:hypothetical protein